MPKVSDSYVETRRQQMLDAAVICFANKGFDSTTIEDICGEAGVSHGAFYIYFQSKEDIIEASFRREMEARAARYSEIMRQSDARRVLEDYLAIYFRRRGEPEEETLTKFRMQLYGESVRNPRLREIQRKGGEETLERAAEIIRKAQEKGEINPHLDALALARIVWAIADGFYIQRSVTPDLDVDACLEAARAALFGDVWMGPGKEANGGGHNE